LLLGTNTSGEEDEFLMIAEVQLPNEDVEREATSFVEKGEAGGFGHGSCKISVTHKFPVEAEVNRARYMPQVRCNCCVPARVLGGVFTPPPHPHPPFLRLSQGSLRLCAC
jgi:hypothetical protein